MSGEIKATPAIEGNLRSHYVRLPHAAWESSGIRILGRNIHAIVYSTDLAIVRNCNADAVFGVYPFTPQQVITKALVETAAAPVFVGVGGGTTNGPRSAALAQDAEADGAYAVVLNSPASYSTLEMVSRVVEIPVIVTVVNDDLDVVAARISSGASIINVSGANKTAEYVANIRAAYPDLPIIATGGTTEESVQATVDAGANAIVCSPPTSKQLQSEMMRLYRENGVPRTASVEERPVSAQSRKELRDRLEEIRKSGLLRNRRLEK